MRSERVVIFAVFLIVVFSFAWLSFSDTGIDWWADQQGDNSQHRPDLPTKASSGITRSTPLGEKSATPSIRSNINIANSSLPQEGDDDSGRDRGHPQEGNKEETPPLGLPQCYSSREADPSLGGWTKCEGGEKACSPSYQEGWAGEKAVPKNYLRCKSRWASEHEGEGPIPYWTWEPSACDMKNVDAETFCRVMAGRKGLLFAGDSMSGHMSDTLAAVLRAEVVEDMELFGLKWVACNGTFRFSWYRNDYLGTRTTKYPTEHCTEPDAANTRCVAFADDSTLGDYDTLVVNSGLHRAEGGLEEYAEMMTNASTFLAASMERLHGEKAVLVARNTVPGHGASYDRAFDGPVDIDTAIQLVDEGPREYLWFTIPDKNKLLEDAFLDTGGSWELLDAYTPTIVRADMHGTQGDGAHYCIPGPVDHWITLLYNILLVKTSLNDYK